MIESLEKISDDKFGNKMQNGKPLLTDENKTEILFVGVLTFFYLFVRVRVYARLSHVLFECDMLICLCLVCASPVFFRALCLFECVCRGQIQTFYRDCALLKWLVTCGLNCGTVFNGID